MLETDLHIVYQVVPIYAAVSWPNLDWMNYLTLWGSLPNDMKRVGELVGVEERFLVRAMRGTINMQLQSHVRELSSNMFVKKNIIFYAIALQFPGFFF